MSDKTKITSAKTLKNRPSTMPAATSSRGRISKEKNVPRSKLNSTVVDPDTTILKTDFLPDFDGENRQIAYGKFLRDMLGECLSDEKIEREETYIDLQMSQLADRFDKTMDLLSKTNSRLKDISFVTEQKRLLDLKSNNCNKFYEVKDSSNAQELLENLSATEQAHLDRIELKNIDFGYDKNSGHKQLLDAVTDAIDGLEQIKKHSNLDLSKIKEYQKAQTSVKDIEKHVLDYQNLKTDYDYKFPKFSEKLLKEASEKITQMINDDDVDDDDDD